VTEAAPSSAERKQDFDRVVSPIAATVRRGLVAEFGVEIGSDVAAEALAWAWEHLDRLAATTNPAGYLYRVGQSAARRHLRWRRGRATFPAQPTWAAVNAPEFDDAMVDALRALKPAQRVAVLLVHGYGFSYRDVAGLLDISEAAVTNHVHRGLARLRMILEEQR
jgi:RNA polymerase sigma factor (sigma-70 family)